MTWELCADLTGRYFSIFLKDDMGISDQIYTWHGTSRKTQTSKMESGRSWDGKTNLPQEIGHPRWELAGRETGRGIYHRRWDIQDGNWQVGRREEEFTTGDGTSKMETGRQGDGKRNLPQEMGHPRWELAGRETGRGIDHRRSDIQDGKWQVGRWEEEFTTGDGTSKKGTGR